MHFSSFLLPLVMAGSAMAKLHGVADPNNPIVKQVVKHGNKEFTTWNPIRGAKTSIRQPRFFATTPFQLASFLGGEGKTQYQNNRWIIIDVRPNSVSSFPGFFCHNCVQYPAEGNKPATTERLKTATGGNGIYSLDLSTFRYVIFVDRDNTLAPGAALEFTRYMARIPAYNYVHTVVIDGESTLSAANWDQSQQAQRKRVRFPDDATFKLWHTAGGEPGVRGVSPLHNEVPETLPIGWKARLISASADSESDQDHWDLTTVDPDTLANRNFRKKQQEEGQNSDGAQKERKKQPAHEIAGSSDAQDSVPGDLFEDDLDDAELQKKIREQKKHDAGQRELQALKDRWNRLNGEAPERKNAGGVGKDSVPEKKQE